MLKNNLPEFILEGLGEFSDNALALTDDDRKIVWYNQKFKDLSGASRLKGRKPGRVFDLLKEKDLTDISDKLNSFEIDENTRLFIKPIIKNKNPEGYVLKLVSYNRKEADNEIISDKNFEFQKELQNILMLLVKEKSLSLIAEEILIRCVNLSRSSYGLVVFHDDNKNNFIAHDPDKIIKNLKDVEKEIESSLSFIKKWLSVNKRSLVAANIPNNIGFNIAETLQSKSVIISPCFFDEKILATVIVGNKNESYSEIEINNTEQLAALLAFAISNTKTRELNTTLENRLLQAQKLETIGKLSSGMAHDFSNLLSSIFGSLNLLKKKVPEEENIYRLLDNIENCSVRAKDLTKGLLSFGKPTPKRKELIKPNLLVNELIKVITQTFPGSIDFEYKVEDNLYDILGNGTEIYQVLLNLCVNAKEAIDKDGQIKLIAKNITIKETNIIDYPLLNKGNYVHFIIKDNGSGIDEENLQRIFDPYFSTKQKDTGSGLGLYVTYGIIKAHKGNIEVTSKLNKGTTFEVFLPSFEPAKESRTSSSDKIILLADDEVMLRDLLGELLESNSYNVIKVSTGVEALRVLTEEIKVDLVIIDYNMPEMNGLDCIEKIRELGFKIPIILSTGSLAFSEDKDYDKYGIDHILAKPYEFDTMLETIKKLI